MRPVPSARRLLLPAALMAALVVPATASAACRGADVPVSQARPSQARHALLCLHNRIRAAHGLHRLHERRSLDRAARSHTRQMVRSHYFDHTSPGGSTLVTRARATGYVRPTLAFSLGENIGWGEGTFATPRAIVRAWMASPEHRRNILFPRFRDVGFGLAAGTPQGTAGATFTTDFGVRG